MIRKWFASIPGLRPVMSRRSRRSLRPTHVRLRGEALEDRVVPATPTITWDGGGGSFDWNTKANWSPDRVPESTDDVEIGSGFAAATIGSTGNVSIHSLTSQASLIV